MVGVGAAPALLSCPEDKEEYDPGQVDDCLLEVYSTLLGNVEGLEDGHGDGADLCRWGVLFFVGGDSLAQLKVELTQLFLPGFAVPHCCEYLPNGIKVLLHGPLLDGYPTGCQRDGAHTLGEDMEERGLIPAALDVVWYF